MALSIESVVNIPVSLVVSSTGSAPSDAVLFKDGVASGVVPVFLQVGSTLAWKVTFTPVATGLYSLFVFGAVQLHSTCVARSLSSFLSNIEDEALGSWSWDKSTGILTILRQNGTVLATHNVVDNQTLASRERVS